MGWLEKDELQNLIKMNEIRNKIVHRYYNVSDQYQKDDFLENIKSYTKISKRTYRRIY